MKKKGVSYAARINPSINLTNKIETERFLLPDQEADTLR